MAAIASFVVISGQMTAANAVDRISVNVVNDREFKLSLEIRDKICGGNVLVRDQFEAGEVRVIEICANPKGVGAVRATFGSGCSQVKRTEFNDIAPGADITF
jgi:hypothetical protein